MKYIDRMVLKLHMLKVDVLGNLAINSAMIMILICMKMKIGKLPSNNVEQFIQTCDSGA